MKLLSAMRAAREYNVTALRILASSNRLNDFAAVWTGNETGYTLQQLAAMRVPEERTTISAIQWRTLVLLCCSLLFAAVIGGVMVGYASGFANGFGAAVILALFLLASSMFWGSSVMEYVSGHENEPIYMAALNKFAEDVEMAAVYLELDLSGLLFNGRKKASQLAGDRLLVWAMEITELERVRDAAVNPKDYAEKAAPAQERRDEFQRQYDVFAALKLETREYGVIFAEARKELAKRQAA